MAGYVPKGRIKHNDFTGYALMKCEPDCYLCAEEQRDKERIAHIERALFAGALSVLTLGGYTVGRFSLAVITERRRTRWSWIGPVIACIALSLLMMALAPIHGWVNLAIAVDVGVGSGFGWAHGRRAMTLSSMYTGPENYSTDLGWTHSTPGHFPKTLYRCPHVRCAYMSERATSCPAHYMPLYRFH